MFQNLRANLLTTRNRQIQPSADDFLSVALPADFALDGTVGAATQVISASSDGSAVITVTVGSLSLGHVQLSLAYAEQQSVFRGGGSPVGTHTVRLTNGDTVTGLGVISRPTTLTGGTQSGNRAWTIMLQSATYTPAVGLAAALAAAGTT